MSVSFSGNTLTISGVDHTLDYPILDARQIYDLIVVLFRPEAFRGGGQFRNLMGLDAHGAECWRAELPTNMGMDAYVQIVSETPLVVDSYCSYRCEIDTATGEVNTKEFFK